MSIFTSKQVNFYYEMHGQGFPLVLIAGLKSDHKGWLSVLDRLAKKYQVILFDNRGVGQTTDMNQPFKIHDMAEDTLNLINYLNLKKPHIVGHSLGGAIAQTLAVKYPSEIGSVALCNTFQQFNPVGREIFNHVLQLHENNVSPADIMEYIANEVFSKNFITSELMKIIRKVSCDNLYPQSTTDYSRQLKALYDFDSRTWLSQIKIPTLIIGSTEDKIATFNEAEDIKESINHAQLIKMTTGHASQVEQPEVFVEHLFSFYQKIENRH